MGWGLQLGDERGYKLNKRFDRAKGGTIFKLKQETKELSKQNGVDMNKYEKTKQN